MSARVGAIGGHVADAGLDRGLDFPGAQTPEMSLGRAHVQSRIVFDVPCQAIQMGQPGERARIGAERFGEPVDLRPAIGLCDRHVGGLAGPLQRQQRLELDAFLV